MIFTKTLYYLKMIETFANHIDMIFRILWEIKFFGIVLAVTMVAFTNSYYLIGRNQIQFDNIDPEEPIIYAEWMGAFWTVTMLSLGNPETDNFFQGDGNQKIYLMCLFGLSAVMILIHLLNMLIAIMADTFTKYNEVQLKMKTKEQLRFVLDKWVFKDYCLDDDGKNQQYIVAAFLQEGEDDEINVLKHMSSHVEEVQTSLVKLQNNLLMEFKEMKFMNEEQVKDNSILQESVN